MKHQPATPMAATDTRDRIVSTAADAANPVVFLDFDGVLSEMVDDPEAAVPIPGTLDALAALIEVGVQVVIVSSRDLEFLRRRFGSMNGVTLSGSAGLETMADGDYVPDPDAVDLAGRIDAAEEEARELAPDGLRVERKTFSLSLHFRRAPHLEDEAIRLGTLLAERHHLMDGLGRQVVELRLPLDRSKGTAIRDRLDHLGAERIVDWAMFAGDDEPDLAGFAELHGQSEADPSFNGFAIGVVGTGSEQPEGFTDAVDLLVDGPIDLQNLLGDIKTARPPSSTDRGT